MVTNNVVWSLTKSTAASCLFGCVSKHCGLFTGCHGDGIPPGDSVGGAYHTHRPPTDTEYPAHVSLPPIYLTVLSMRNCTVEPLNADTLRLRGGVLIGVMS